MSPASLAPPPPSSPLLAPASLSVQPATVVSWMIGPPSGPSQCMSCGPRTALPAVLQVPGLGSRTDVTFDSDVPPPLLLLLQATTTPMLVAATDAQSAYRNQCLWTCMEQSLRLRIRKLRRWVGQ